MFLGGEWAEVLAETVGCRTLLSAKPVSLTCSL